MSEFQIFLAKKLIALNQQDPKQRPTDIRNKRETIEWQTRMDHANGSMIVIGQNHSCKVPLNQLESIKLNGLQVPKIHFGHYLVCKTIDDAKPGVSVRVLVEDLGGEMEELVINNYTSNFKEVKWLPVGTILVVKEPHLKYRFKETDVHLQVDSPSNLIFVDPTDLDFLNGIGAEKWHANEVRTADGIRLAGNDHFKRGEYEVACRLYERGIRLYPEVPDFYLNKSMTCLKSDCHFEAYVSAKTGLEKGGDRVKALHRMGLAAYGMRDWRLAIEHFTDLTKEFPSSYDENTKPDKEKAYNNLKRSIARLAESETGIFDIAVFLREGNLDNFNLDIADYTGPIKVESVSGKGRRLIATHDIKKGTILSVCKAFVANNIENLPKNLFVWNAATEQQELDLSWFQVIYVTEKLRKNPQAERHLYSLNIDNLPVEREVPNGVLDMERIKEACVKNSSIGGRFAHTELGLDSDTLHTGICLFPIKSYSKHSCIANSVVASNGDLFILRAYKNITKGSEIIWSYVPAMVRYEKRKTMLMNYWGIECDCDLCQVERNDPHSKERAMLIDQFKAIYDSNLMTDRGLLAESQKILEKMRRLSEKLPRYKSDLALFLCTLSHIAAVVRDFPLLLSYWNECIELAGEFDVAFELDCHAFRHALALSPIDLNQAKKFARQSFEISLFNNKNQYLAVYPEMKDLLS